VWSCPSLGITTKGWERIEARRGCGFFNRRGAWPSPATAMLNQRWGSISQGLLQMSRCCTRGRARSGRDALR
jgi:hypothetical protein